MSEVVTQLNCPCCNGGSGPPPCVEISPAPSATLHAVLTWHRPLFFGGEVVVGFDCVWDAVDLLKWRFEPMIDDGAGNMIPDPVPFCTIFSVYMFNLGEFSVNPELCDDTKPRGPGLATGGAVVVGYAAAVYNYAGSGGLADATSIGSVSPLALSGTLLTTPGCHYNVFADPAGELDGDGNPVTSGPGWPVTFVITEVP